QALSPACPAADGERAWKRFKANPPRGGDAKLEASPQGEVARLPLSEPKSRAPKEALMSRISVILSSPRHLLGALLVALLAVGAVVGSGASFTSKSANP